MPQIPPSCCVNAESVMSGSVPNQGGVHMVAALAGCRKVLVGTGLDISLLFDINRLDKGQKSGIGGDGRVSAQGTVHMVASCLSWL